jgi:lipopolysaccharide assembly outer membrane protein LptD (OstA)
LNFLLSLNKKIFLIFSIIFFCVLIFFLLFFIQTGEKPKKVEIYYNKNSDITKPKFSINSNKQKILISANEGNFITEDEIMLENNVIFKSKKFKILGDNVIFDKKKLIASSSNKSKFISKNASIDSIGFDIIENGNIINFKGSTKLTLK